MKEESIVEYLHRTIPKKILKELFIREYGEEYLPENIGRVDTLYGIPITDSLMEQLWTLQITYRKTERIVFHGEETNKLLHTYKGGIASKQKTVIRDVVTAVINEVTVTLPLEFFVSDCGRILGEYGQKELWKYANLRYMRDGFSIYDFFVKDIVESGKVSSVTCDPGTHWFNVNKSKFIYESKEN